MIDEQWTLPWPEWDSSLRVMLMWRKFTTMTTRLKAMSRSSENLFHADTINRIRVEIYCVSN